MIRKYDKLGRFHNTELDENGRTLPAVAASSGTKMWYFHGLLHNSDLDENGRTLPAVEYSNGTKMYYKYGERHNSDIDEQGDFLPACVYQNGTVEYWRYGVKHNTKNFYTQSIQYNIFNFLESIRYIIHHPKDFKLGV